MPTIRQQMRTAYSTDMMYALVSEVEAYPDFIPWCREAEILTRHRDGITARLFLVRGRLRCALTTRNRQQPCHSIAMNLVEGPFRSLQGHWLFEPLSSGSQVSLELDFVLSRQSLRALWVAPLLLPILRGMPAYFLAQAERLHATPSSNE